MSGLTLETAVLTPVAVVHARRRRRDHRNRDRHRRAPGSCCSCCCAGAVTATPLLLFAAAARRLPLVYIGLTQYLAPVIQFIVGVVVLHEDMPLERWIGFALVWVALDRADRRHARAAAAPRVAPPSNSV